MNRQHVTQISPQHVLSVVNTPEGERRTDGWSDGKRDDRIRGRLGTDMHVRVCSTCYEMINLRS